MFSPNLATKIYGQIASIDAIKGQWKLANTLSPKMVQRLQTSVLVTSTGASTRIEGSKLSDKELLEWTSQELIGDTYPTLLIITNFLFEFLVIHPFQDGNERLNRILTNFPLLQSGYSFCPFVSHEKIIENNKADYYLALNKTQQARKTETEDISPWVLFFLSVLDQQSQQALELMADEPTEIFLSERQRQV